MAGKKKLKRDQLRTWVEIDRGKIRHNFKLFRSLIPRTTTVCAVVKSNAYGHGLVEYTKEALKAGADMVAVDSVIEGIRLREEGVTKRIFVLGYTLPPMLTEALRYDIEVTIAGKAALHEACALTTKKKLRVHIKIDSGMSRQGFFLDELDTVLSQLANASHINFTGLYTHFANAKLPAFPHDTNTQRDIFIQAIKKVKDAGYAPDIHAAATSSTILFPELHYDMVRIGIGGYGLWPSKETQAYAEDFIPLKPVLTWKTVVGDVKEIPKGAGISYGFSERVEKKTRIGIVPVGYWHGYDRGLSSMGHVVIRGVSARVLGCVTMDIIIVDLSRVKDAKVGDEVVLLGGQGVSADDMASLLGTINYEVVTRINPKIKRVVVED